MQLQEVKFVSEDDWVKLVITSRPTKYTHEGM